MISLNDPVTTLPLVGAYYAKKLKLLNIQSIRDLIFYTPFRYEDFRESSSIKDIQVGSLLSIKGKITSIDNVYTRYGKNFQLAKIEDQNGSMNIMWFNQPYLVKSLKKNSFYSFAGKVSWYSGKKCMISPEFEPVVKDNLTLHTSGLIPVYPETAGISSKWLRGKIKTALSLTEGDIREYLPKKDLQKYGLISIEKALPWVHFPQTKEQAESARTRLAFDELLTYNLISLKRKQKWNKNTVSLKISVNKDLFEKFSKSLPFKLTNSQNKAIGEIYKDFRNSTPMNRLLEGDVGSGKTAVAAAGAFASYVNGYQSVFMAPTQILANQHYKTLKEIFKKFKVRISLVTSSGVKSDLGKTDIFVGTHALLHNKVDFDNAAFVVIDEQHRFGVKQRQKLIKKSKSKTYSPHILTMTATPIPRTVALTIYGDLDLSTLDELPYGRQSITTWVVPPHKRENAYNWIIKNILKNKIQVFIICPLIEESKSESLKSVKAVLGEYKELKKIFSGFKIGVLHGRQSEAIKNNVLTTFKHGKTNILLSTPVVEVGIDIPNATIILIEAAERYGLAQLHQLRGRVGRSDIKSYCLLFSDSKSVKVLTRLNALTKSLSGFELAELDLKLRGPGELLGIKQHGFPELKIASWSDLNLINKSRKLAEEIIKKPNLYNISGKNFLPDNTNN